MFDEHTGATVTVVGAPITFVRRPNGQSSPDFLTLVAIQRDDAGQYTDMLLLYRWSVFFGPVSAAPEQGAGELQIEVDGQPMTLQPLPQMPAGLPKPEDLFVPDSTAAALQAYVTDLKTMSLIATSHDLVLRLHPPSGGDPFSLWRDGRAALAQFVKHLSAP